MSRRRAVDVHASHEAHSHGQHLKSVMHGGLDGIITTFVVVAGVVDASLDTTIVFILRFANVIADDLSMAIGDFLRTKTELQLAVTERGREMWEAEHLPDRERVELGMPESDESPLGKGLATFLSFVVFGFVPLVAYVLSRLVALGISPLLLTAVTLFVLGTVKVRVVQMHWLRAGSEMLLVGGVGAVAAYVIGTAIRAIVSA